MCNTVTALLLSLDDYDDPVMVIDDVIHPSPVRFYCTPHASSCLHWSGLLSLLPHTNRCRIGVAHVR